MTLWVSFILAAQHRLSISAGPGRGESIRYSLKQERDKLLYTTVSALYRGDMDPLNMDSLYLIEEK
jgi:hypothetical protein